MQKLLLSFLLLLIISIQSCFLSEEECKKTEAPEINFGLLFSGNVIIYNESDENITADFVDKDLNMLYYKVYCSGKNNGPFTTEFAINEDGSLYKKTIGYWSFRMNNTKDYIRVKFFIEGDEVGYSYNVTYDQLKAYDGSNPFLQFNLVLTYNGSSFKTRSISLSIQ